MRCPEKFVSERTHISFILSNYARKLNSFVITIELWFSCVTRQCCDTNDIVQTAKQKEHVSLDNFSGHLMSSFLPYLLLCSFISICIIFKEFHISNLKNVAKLDSASYSAMKY